jgi:hypothetical protein
MYTGFGDPLMATIFAFPSDLWATRLFLALKLLLPIFSILWLSLWATGEIGQYYIKWIQSRLPGAKQSTTKDNWKPWATQLPFLSMVLLATIIIIVTVRMLWYISSLTNPNRSRK